MINIKEGITKKMPGKTSLFISFDYKQEIVDTMKTLPNSMFHKKEKEWEVPVSQLSEVLDKLCLYDTIECEFLKDKKKKEPVIYELQKYKTKPFDYQLDGIQYGLNHDKWLLLDPPGLGKTLQIIYIAQELKERENLEHCLIICGINTLKTNWKNEILKHSDLSVRILGERVNKKGNITIGGIKDRIEDLKKPIKEFFVITNIESLRDDDIIKLLKDNKNNNFDMIIFDELHKCFEYNTTITTNKGRLKIGDIVRNKINCKVLSYNQKTNSYEFLKIKNFFEYQTETLLELTILDNHTGEYKQIKCTPSHKIYTYNRGYVEAQNLVESDEIFIAE